MTLILNLLSKLAWGTTIEITNTMRYMD